MPSARSGEERTPFQLPVPFRARRLAIDPEFHLFRLLHQEVVAPVLSGVLGADSTQIVLGEDGDDDVRTALRDLAESWAKDSTFSVVEEAAAGRDFPGAVWYFGDGARSRAFRASAVLSRRAEGRDAGPEGECDDA